MDTNTPTPETLTLTDPDEIAAVKLLRNLDGAAIERERISRGQLNLQSHFTGSRVFGAISPYQEYLDDREVKRMLESIDRNIAEQNRLMGEEATRAALGDPETVTGRRR